MTRVEWLSENNQGKKRDPVPDKWNKPKMILTNSYETSFAYMAGRARKQ